MWTCPNTYFKIWSRHQVYCIISFYVGINCIAFLSNEYIVLQFTLHMTLFPQGYVDNRLKGLAMRSLYTHKINVSHFEWKQANLNPPKPAPTCLPPEPFRLPVSSRSFGARIMCELFGGLLPRGLWRYGSGCNPGRKMSRGGVGWGGRGREAGYLHLWAILLSHFIG